MTVGGALTVGPQEVLGDPAARSPLLMQTGAEAPAAVRYSRDCDETTSGSLANVTDGTALL